MNKYTKSICGEWTENKEQNGMNDGKPGKSYENLISYVKIRHKIRGKSEESRPSIFEGGKSGY